MSERMRKIKDEIKLYLPWSSPLLPSNCFKINNKYFLTSARYSLVFGWPALTDATVGRVTCTPTKSTCDLVDAISRYRLPLSHYFKYSSKNLGQKFPQNWCRYTRNVIRALRRPPDWKPEWFIDLLDSLIYLRINHCNFILVRWVSSIFPLRRAVEYLSQSLIFRSCQDILDTALSITILGGNNPLLTLTKFAFVNIS